jgi:hypothetical protein
MTSQGTAHGRFTRAIQQRNLFAAEMALREIGTPSLLDALDYLALLAETKVEKLPGAALRWHGRFELEPDLDQAADGVARRSPFREGVLADAVAQRTRQPNGDRVHSQSLFHGRTAPLSSPAQRPPNLVPNLVPTSADQTALNGRKRPVEAASVRHCRSCGRPVNRRVVGSSPTRGASHRL